MRRTINVLWLDDTQVDLEHIKDIFVNALKESGYLCNITTESNIDDAEIKIKNKKERIDFFVSDYTLADNETGIDFLFKVRSEKYNKQHFILYSSLNKSNLRDHIIGKISERQELLDCLNNYSFFSIGNGLSTSSIQHCFEDSISLALNRWNELSALRGEYASMHTLAECITRKILAKIKGNSNYLDTEATSSVSYHICLKELQDLIIKGLMLSSLSSYDLKRIFCKWHESKKIRNDLEHNTEKWDSGSLDYYIQKDGSSDPIFEKDIAKFRKSLVSQMTNVLELISNLIQVNDQLSNFNMDVDFINLKGNF